MKVWDSVVHECSIQVQYLGLGNVREDYDLMRSTDVIESVSELTI